MDIFRKILKVRISVLFCVLLFARASSPAQLPYTTARNTDLPLLGSGIAALLADRIPGKSLPPIGIEELQSLSRSSVNRIDRHATYLYSASKSKWSDILVGFSVVSPAGLFRNRNVRLYAGTFSLMYLETILLSTFIPQLCKRSVERYRPYVYNPDAPLSVRIKPDSRRSFFSGHTTTAFAAAVFLSTVYSNTQNTGRWRSFVWTGSLLSASLVSYLRYASGAHFPTDILAGALTGAALGFLVPALHRTTK
jgi:membrane-associated phospholipid phosphatase